MDKFKTYLLSTFLVLGFATAGHAADLEAVATEAAPEAEEKSFFPGSFSASAGFYTDYRFRGLSQTDEEAAVQGTIEWSVDTPVEGVSLTLGAFGSNINFTPNTGAPDDGSIEIDYYGSLSGEYNGIGWSVGGIYYQYPDASNSLNQDFFEFTLGTSYSITDDFGVALDYAFSPEFFGDTGEAHNVRGSASYNLSFIPSPFPLSLAGGLGYQEFEGDGDYFYWDIGLSAEIHKNVSLSVQYIDTDTELVFEDRDIADSTVVGSISVSF
ncbi:MAG: TorF family putative porin [Hyphomicrobiales bacterium]